MDCKNTCTDRPAIRSLRSAGLSLIELMVAIGVGSIALMALLSVTVFSSRSFVALGNYAELDANNRKVLDDMTREIRQARRVISYSQNTAPPYQTNLIVLESGDGGTLTYHFKPADRVLEKTVNNLPSQVILTNCDHLAFNLMQRNPAHNFDVWQIATSNTAKVIQVNWRCSATILGQKVNTENVQTARIVIRKQGSI